MKFRLHTVLLTLIILLSFSADMIAQDTTRTIVTDDSEITVIIKISDGGDITIDKREYDTENMSDSRIKELEKELNIEIDKSSDNVTIKRRGKADSSIEEMEREVEEMERKMEEEEDKMENDADDWSGIEEDWWEDRKEKEKQLDNIKTRWLLFRFGVNSFIRDGEMPTIRNDVDPTELKVWGSFNWGIAVFQTRFNLINHYLNLKTGLGVDFNYYSFDNNVTLVDQSQKVEWKYEDFYELDNNNLYVSYVRIPLMLNVETNPYNSSRSFKINAGVYGGLKMSSRLKQNFNNRTLKVRDDFNISDWTYGLTGSIGYGSFNIYANYSLVGLFKEDADNGYKLSPFNIGIEVLPF